MRSHNCPAFCISSKKMLSLYIGPDRKSGEYFTDKTLGFSGSHHAREGVSLPGQCVCCSSDEERPGTPYRYGNSG